MGTETRDVESAPSHGAPGQGAAAGVETDPRVRKAMDSLRTAAQRKRIEPICEAYEALRTTAGSLNVRARQTLRLAEGALGASAVELVASAYARRGCFMCEQGVAPCDHCQGTGFLEAERSCPRCRGLAVMECGFCEGTAWADQTDLPEELAKPVFRRRRARVAGDLKSLGAEASKLRPETIGRLSPSERRKLASWLIRMEARLAELARSQFVDDAERQRLTHTAETIGRCLEVLRKHAVPIRTDNE